MIHISIHVGSQVRKWQSSHHFLVSTCLPFCLIIVESPYLDASAPRKTVYAHYRYPASPPHMPSIPRFKKFPTTPSAWLSNFETTKLKLTDLMGADLWKRLEKQLKEEKAGKNIPKEMKSPKTNKWGAQYVEASVGASPLTIPCGGKQAEKKEKVYEEKAGGKWLEQLVEGTGWDVHWNCEIPKHAQGYLRPYYMSPKYRPDIWLSVTLDECCYQLLLIEILSKADIDLTVQECERSLIHQLRVFRNYSVYVTEVIGFVLPTTKYACEILEVSIQWNEHSLWFQSNIKALTQKQFMERIFAIGHLQHDIIAKQLHRRSNECFFLPVNAQLLFNDKKAVQLPSGQSIVVASKEMVYKSIIDLEVSLDFQTRLLDSFSKLEHLDCVSLPTMQIVDECVELKRKKGFMQFTKVIYPLERKEAQQCLMDLLQESAKALRKLHDAGFAHLDVRLENIAFKLNPDGGSVNVILIDFDSFLPINDNPRTVSSSSRMSVPPKDVSAYNNTHLDWKQLGMVAAYVASYPKPISHEEYHSVKFCFGPVEEEAFVENLLLKGTRLVIMTL